jgi:hypothetical protein
MHSCQNVVHSNVHLFQPGILRAAFTDFSEFEPVDFPLRSLAAFIGVFFIDGNPFLQHNVAPL